MKENKMYSDRIKNIAAFRGCNFGCVYCEKTFKRLIMINKACPKCMIFEPHFHPEALLKTPPKTKNGEFLTIGLSSDISFMPWNEFEQVLNYCHKWNDRIFLIQSKNPEVFAKHFVNCNNVILGTTLETNKYKSINYKSLSNAPNPYYRYCAMLKLNCRKAITIEPILKFDDTDFKEWIKDIAPEFVYIGYANDKHEGKSLKLPEPPIYKTLKLIEELRGAGIEVREKTIRKAWYE